MKRNMLILGLFLSLTFSAAVANASATYFKSDKERDAYDNLKIGMDYAAQGNYEKAIELLKKANELNPSSDVDYNLGMVYRDMKDYENSAKYFGKVYEKTPDDMNLNYYYGLVLLEQKKYKEALPKFEFILSKEPEAEPIKELAEKARKGLAE